MNYIQQLKLDNESLKEQVNQVKADLDQLLAYISSEKFQGNSDLAGYVNVKDIMLRVNEIKVNL